MRILTTGMCCSGYRVPSEGVGGLNAHYWSQQSRTVQLPRPIILLSIAILLQLYSSPLRISILMVFEKIGKYIYFKLETDRIVYLLSVNNVPGTTLRMGTTSDRLAYRLAFSAASAVEDISRMRFNQSDDGSCHLHSACRTLPCLLCSLLLLRLSDPKVSYRMCLI